MDPETARVEHLKLIQAVITRLARSSFAVKSATVAASAARIAFSAATDSPLVSVAGTAILPLWLLDASYLRRERSFRRFYDHVRIGPPSDLGDPDYFTMDVGVPEGREAGLPRVAVSRTLAVVYLPLLVLIGLSAFI